MTDGHQGQVATEAAEIYEEFFIPALFGQWPERVLDACAVGPGHRILDVGCGTGVLARAASRRVGPTTRVVGVDPNAGMLAVAGRSREPVEWTPAMAENLPFEDGEFDRVVSQFAAMFFTDRDQAVAEMRRVLVSDGCVAIATWASLEMTPGYAAMVELLRDLFGEDAARELTGPFVMGDPDELGELLSTRFDDVRVTRHGGMARFESIDAWIHTDIRGWTLSRVIDEDEYQTLLARARTDLSGFVDDSGRVEFPVPALITDGRAA